MVTAWRLHTERGSGAAFWIKVAFSIWPLWSLCACNACKCALYNQSCKVLSGFEIVLRGWKLTDLTVLLYDKTLLVCIHELLFLMQHMCTWIFTNSTGPKEYMQCICVHAWRCDCSATQAGLTSSLGFRKNQTHSYGKVICSHKPPPPNPPSLPACLLSSSLSRSSSITLPFPGHFSALLIYSLGLKSSL